MKMRITLKDPDGVSTSIEEAAKESVRKVTGIDEDERNDLIQNRVEELEDLAAAWVKYGEYVTIEIDTETAKATVARND